MIRSGDDVKIVDNNSKEDLTTVTLAQIIFEEEKKQKSFLPLNAMRNIIQSGGERIEELVSQAQKRVSGVFHRKDKGADASAPAAGSDGAEVAAEHEPEKAEKGRAFRDFFEEWQHKIDERVRHVMEGLSPLHPLQKEVGALAARMAEIEKKLAKLLGEAESESQRGGNGA